VISEEILKKILHTYSESRGGSKESCPEDEDSILRNDYVIEDTFVADIEDTSILVCNTKKENKVERGK